MSPVSACRTFIVYRSGLFARGVRSILEEQHGVQIVGMEKEVARAVKAVRSLQPEVILIEEPTKAERTWSFLPLTSWGRIVTLSLDHTYVTVYDHHRIAARGPADLVKAIQGSRSHAARTHRISQARPIRKQEANAGETAPSTSRGTRKHLQGGRGQRGNSSRSGRHPS